MHAPIHSPKRARVSGQGGLPIWPPGGQGPTVGPLAAKRSKVLHRRLDLAGDVAAHLLEDPGLLHQLDESLRVGDLPENGHENKTTSEWWPSNYKSWESLAQFIL